MDDGYGVDFDEGDARDGGVGIGEDRFWGAWRMSLRALFYFSKYFDLENRRMEADSWGRD